MGGSGSGNFYHWRRSPKKTVVGDCLRLDANRWMREGILKAGADLDGRWGWTYASGAGFHMSYRVNTLDLDRPRLQLSYSWVWNSTGEQGAENYPVCLTTTRPRFGGLRWWFLCPLFVDGRACRRRVGKLYLPPRCRFFGCRHCYRLTYTSCQESHKCDLLYRVLAQNTGIDFETVKQTIDQLCK